MVGPTWRASGSFFGGTSLDENTRVLASHAKKATRANGTYVHRLAVKTKFKSDLKTHNQARYSRALSHKKK